MCNDNGFQYELVLHKDDGHCHFPQDRDKSWFQFYGESGFREMLIWAGIICDSGGDVGVMITGRGSVR